MGDLVLVVKTDGGSSSRAARLGRATPRGTRRDEEMPR